MCALFPSMRRQSIAMCTNTSKLRLLSCSCPLTLPSAYFLAEKENDRKVPSGLTMWPDPVAEPTTGLGAAGAGWASNPASGRAPTSISRATFRFIVSPPPFRRYPAPWPERESLPERHVRQVVASQERCPRRSLHAEHQVAPRWKAGAPGRCAPEHRNGRDATVLARSDV